MRGKTFFAKTADNIFLKFAAKVDLDGFLRRHPGVEPIPFNNPELRRLQRKGYWRPVPGVLDPHGIRIPYERLVVSADAVPPQRPQ